MHAIGCNIVCDIYYTNMRLVFDTDVMVAAQRSDAGASRQLIEAALRREIVPLLTVPLMLEYESVMLRHEHLLESSASIADVGALLDAIVAVGERVRLAFLWRPALNDADDEMVLEAAVNGRADALVTFNRRDFGNAAEQFSIPVITPGEALKLMRKAP